jgi:hypothetical protein
VYYESPFFVREHAHEPDEDEAGNEESSDAVVECEADEGKGEGDEEEFWEVDEEVG